MLFKYIYNMSKAEAETAAKYARTNLITSLIAQYKALETIHKKEEREDLSDFLRTFRRGIHDINDCQTDTSALHNTLEKKLATLQAHPKYADIKEIVDEGMLAINRESNFAQDRMRNLTKNNIAKIKNHAIYAASLPSMAVVGSIILAMLHPVGWIALGVAAMATALSQTIFWAHYHNKYTQFHAKLENNDLEADYATGNAVQFDALPQDPARALIVKNVDPEQDTRKPVLISETADQIMDELAELVPDLMSDATAAVCNHAMGFWSSFSNAVVGTSAIAAPVTKPHLHVL